MYIRNPALEKRERIGSWLFPVQYLREKLTDTGTCIIKFIVNLLINRRYAESRIQSNGQRPHVQLLYDQFVEVRIFQQAALAK